MKCLIKSLIFTKQYLTLHVLIKKKIIKMDNDNETCKIP